LNQAATGGVVGEILETKSAAWQKVTSPSSRFSFLLISFSYLLLLLLHFPFSSSSPSTSLSSLSFLPASFSHTFLELSSTSSKKGDYFVGFLPWRKTQIILEAGVKSLTKIPDEFKKFASYFIGEKNFLFNLPFFFFTLSHSIYSYIPSFLSFPFRCLWNAWSLSASPNREDRRTKGRRSCIRQRSGRCCGLGCRSNPQTQGCEDHRFRWVSTPLFFLLFCSFSSFSSSLCLTPSLSSTFSHLFFSLFVSPLSVRTRRFNFSRISDLTTLSTITLQISTKLYPTQLPKVLIFTLITWEVPHLKLHSIT
jgi:hypothetical protein